MTAPLYSPVIVGRFWQILFNWRTPWGLLVHSQELGELDRQKDGCYQTYYEVRYKKTNLKVFVVVIPNEGLAGGAIDHRFIPFIDRRWYFIDGVIPKEGLAGPHPSIFLLVWQWERPQGLFSRDTPHYFLITSRISGRGNRIGPVFQCVRPSVS